MEKLSSPLKNLHGSKVTRNPLREWRGDRTQWEAADVLAYGFLDYVQLESSPDKRCITTEEIFYIVSATQIPLPVLVDWLTETTTKEMA